MNLTTSNILKIGIFLLSMQALNTSAGNLRATVSETSKGQLVNAVVYAIPAAGLTDNEKSAGNKTIDQIDKEFVPSVSVFQTGVNVEFPNHDNVRHHVYSFSPAKTFEIPLYKGIPAEPISFDQPGVVNLGCNIHDWMSAHVFITDTPYFGVSDAEGNVVLHDLPSGAYNVYVWHPQQSVATESTAQQIVLEDGDTPNLSFSIQEKKQWVPFRAPTRAAGSYR